MSDMKKVLEVYKNKDGISVSMADPAAAGVDGKHALDDWTYVLSTAVAAVAETVYEGSHQLTQEMLQRVKEGIDVYMDANKEKYEKWLRSQPKGETPKEPTPGVTDEAFLKELDEIAQEINDEDEELARAIARLQEMSEMDLGELPDWATEEPENFSALVITFDPGHFKNKEI